MSVPVCLASIHFLFLLFETKYDSPASAAPVLGLTCVGQHIWLRDLYFEVVWPSYDGERTLHLSCKDLKL